MMNLDDVLRLTEAAIALAEANPETVYEPPDPDNPTNCSYLEGEAAGREGCLFGQALADIGRPAHQHEEGLGIDSLIKTRLGHIVDTGEEWSFDVGLRGLRAAQSCQDQGSVWGSTLYLLGEARTAFLAELAEQ